MNRTNACAWNLGAYLSALLIGGWLVLAWVSPGFANGPSDEAKKVAVDASGNVYVTGKSWNGANFDYVTIKYSSAGAWLWGRRFNGTGDGDDEPTGLAVDAGGNVIVTGYSWNGANFDYVTIKYDPSGAWLWGQQYNSGADSDDRAQALAVDASGNVYVNGDSWDGDNADYVTIKYDSNGNWVWGRRYGSPTHLSDYGTGLALDSAGNVCVTGYSYNDANYDYVTIKYDAGGDWVWGRRYNGPANSQDQANYLAVDASGNVYVTGYSFNGVDKDYVTIKYDSSGTWVWGRRYNGPANGTDDPSAIAADAAGNVLVAGPSWNGANYDYVTIKYSPAGAWLWGRRYNGSGNGWDWPRDAAVDASGNVYVTGYSYGIAINDYVTIKYSSTGNWIWGRRYNGPANSDDGANALAVDAAGNVLVTGYSWNGTNYDYVTIKYDSGGVWLWGARYDGPD